jgi:hypothetical protein
MDFTKKDARGAAEKAQFCQLRWPESGDYISDDGKPVGVMVLGAMARSVQASLKDDARAKLQEAKGKSKADEVRALEDVQRDLVQSAARLTVGFQGVQRGDAEAKAPDDCEWFYDLNMFSTASLLSPKDEWQGQSFAQQVLAFSNDAGNFLGNG